MFFIKMKELKIGRKLIFFIFIIFTIAGLTIFKSNQKQKIFLNNQKCLEDKPQILKQLKDESTPYSEKVLDEIFYSPSENCCMYSFGTNLTPQNTNYIEGERNIIWFIIRKYFSHLDYARFDKDGYNSLTKTYFWDTEKKLKQTKLFF